MASTIPTKPFTRTSLAAPTATIPAIAIASSRLTSTGSRWRRLHRLPVEVSLELAIAIAGIVAVGAASEVLVKGLVGIVEAILSEIEADDEILAHHLWIPLRGIDLFQLA